MANKKESSNKGLGFIDKDLFIDGSIHSQKKMVVSGTVKGTIYGDQEIVVSESGHVNGRVEGNRILIAGKVNGDLLAHKRLEIFSTATIQGDMKAPSGQILIQEGADLDAKCTAFFEPQTKKHLSS